VSRPQFSCVIPVKGKRPYFNEAVASLEAQGFGDNLEIIVQDGDVELDAGQSDALNKGFAKAKSEWLFWLNADDVLLPEALKKVQQLITHNSQLTTLNWIAGNVVYMDKSGCAKWCAWDRGWKLSYAGLPVQVYGPSSFFRRELFEKSGGFDVSLKYAMDVDLWCKFRKMGYWYKKLPDFVWGFRLHEGSKTSYAQERRWTPEQVAEQKIINERYGLNHVRLATRVAQFSRLINGSYGRSWVETHRRRGRPVA
jgi:glycosyltransferase involved in cell wall biosynthesis